VSRNAHGHAPRRPPHTVHPLVLPQRSAWPTAAACCQHPTRPGSHDAQPSPPPTHTHTHAHTHTHTHTHSHAGLVLCWVTHDAIQQRVNRRACVSVGREAEAACARGCLNMAVWVCGACVCGRPLDSTWRPEQSAACCARTPCPPSAEVPACCTPPPQNTHSRTHTRTHTHTRYLPPPQTTTTAPAGALKSTAFLSCHLLLLARRLAWAAGPARGVCGQRARGQARVWVAVLRACCDVWRAPAATQCSATQLAGLGRPRRCRG
jgi:hypothetical protein